MLYTKKGDDGKTSIFSTKGGPASSWGCDQRLSKSSAITEALGCLDEANSFLGVCKAKTKNIEYRISNTEISEIVYRVQNDLFIIQAQVAGADKGIKNEEVKYIESIIDNIEKELPPIKSFLISGSNEISASFDFARTLARRAERRVVAVSEEGITKINSQTLVYLNRLSSLLYALARLMAQESGVEIAPKY